MLIPVNLRLGLYLSGYVIEKFVFNSLLNVKFNMFEKWVGGGKKVTRVEVTMNGGETWDMCMLDHPAKPNKFGKYWCWCLWSLEVEVSKLLNAKEIAVRAWDETNNTQPEKLIWNLMVCIVRN